MKKIIALLILFVMTFTSGYATTGEHTTLNYDDILKAEIFYINGQGYTKEDGKLKKVEGIKFYSINGQRYINKNGSIEKITENKIKKINGINYVVENNNLITLEKYLEKNQLTKNDFKEDNTKSNLNTQNIYKELNSNTLENKNNNEDDLSFENIFKELNLDLVNNEDEIIFNSAEEKVDNTYIPEFELQDNNEPIEEISN